MTRIREIPVAGVGVQTDLGHHPANGRRPMPASPATAADGPVRIENDVAIVEARRRGRSMALTLGFSAGSATLIATAISELARNILLYAGVGEVGLEPVENQGRIGLAVRAHDRGPGISDIDRALEDGFSTSGRSGLGLPGVRRLMDEFELRSQPGSGTTVRAVLWTR